jgi:Family of unknown function (DUF6011)
MSDAAMFTNATEALNFIMSGNAYFTVVSKRTGQRFTFNVKRSHNAKLKGDTDNGFRYVKMMTGRDNESSYTYIGTIMKGDYKHSAKGGVSVTSTGVIALSWVMRWLVSGNLQSDKMEIWHDGRCGKCARRLTVPSSIANGIGPECAKSAFKCV